jgi:hypothetical protein
MPSGFLSSFVKASSMAAILTCASLGSLRGQGTKSCPDWSPKFDQIQGSATRRELQSERAAGWTQVNASLSNPSQTFAQGNQIIAMAQSRIQSDLQGIQKIAVGNPGPVNDAICTSHQGNALSALQCDIFYSQDLILATQGLLELVQCRSGFSGAIGGGSFSGGNRSVGSNANMGDLLASLTAAKAPAPPLASQSHFQEFENNRVNSDVVGDTAGQEQADASSNASQMAANDKTTDTLKSEVDGLLASNNIADSIQPNPQANDAKTQEANNSEWKDPLAEGSQDSGTTSAGANSPDLNLRNDSGTVLNQSQENQTADPVGVADAAQSTSSNDLTTRNEELAADLLKKGIADSGEVGGTVVQAFDNAQGWLKLKSSDPNDEIDGITQLARGANESFNENGLSKAIVNEGAGIIGSVDKQAFNTLDTANRAFFKGDVSQSEINAQFDDIPKSFARSLIPGYNAAETIQLDLQNAQKNITNRFNSGIQSIQNFLTGKQPPCVFCP